MENLDDPKQAAALLGKLADRGTGASRAAASVLLYVWNSKYPIWDLYKLDEQHFHAAMVLLTVSRFQNVTEGGEAIEKWSGCDMPSLAKEYR